MVKKFEYKEWHGKTNVLDESDYGNNYLKRLGQEGWELVSVLQGSGTSHTYFFKREIESPLTQKQEQPKQSAQKQPQEQGRQKTLGGSAPSWLDGSGR